MIHYDRTSLFSFFSFLSSFSIVVETGDIRASAALKMGMKKQESGCTYRIHTSIYIRVYYNE